MLANCRFLQAADLPGKQHGNPMRSLHERPSFLRNKKLLMRARTLSVCLSCIHCKDTIPGCTGGANCPTRKRTLPSFLFLSLRNSYFGCARLFFSSPEWSLFSFCVCGQPGGTAFLCGLPGPSPGEGRTGGTETPPRFRRPYFRKDPFIVAIRLKPFCLDMVMGIIDATTQDSTCPLSRKNCVENVPSFFRRKATQQ